MAFAFQGRTHIRSVRWLRLLQSNALHVVCRHLDRIKEAYWLAYEGMHMQKFYSINPAVVASECRPGPGERRRNGRRE
jgi:hypothetical protein